MLGEIKPLVQVLRDKSSIGFLDEPKEHLGFNKARKSLTEAARLVKLETLGIDLCLQHSFQICDVDAKLPGVDLLLKLEQLFGLQVIRRLVVKQLLGRL